MFANTFVTRTLSTLAPLAAVLALFGCASADRQSAPGEEHGATADREVPTKEPAPEADNKEPATTTSVLAACNAGCVAGYYRAEGECEGNKACYTCAQNAEEACLARCAGRIPVYKPCEP